MDTLERTQKVVANCLAQDLHEVRPESRLIMDLRADSLDLLELVFLLEQEFDVPLNADELIPHGREVIERLTVADLAMVLDAKRSACGK